MLMKKGRNKRRNKQTLNLILIGTIIFSIGFISGKLTNWGYFTISKEISIAEAISIFLTIGVAIYITNVLERDLQDNRNEKDLLLRRTDEISNKINECLNTISSDTISFFKITHGIQRINLSIRYVFEAIIKLEIESVESDLRDSYVGDIKRLRDLCTNTPIAQEENSEPKPDIEIKDNKVFLSESRRSQVEQELEKLKNKVFMLQVEINRL